jgi:hypothetical protein
MLNMIPTLRPIGLGLGLAVMMSAGILSEGPGDEAPSNQPPRMQISPTTPKLARPNIDALVADILARPLFNPSRQPANEASAETADGAAEPPKMPRRLEGITIGPQAKEALFEREGEKPIAVKEGQMIEGWTVASIRADQVLLKSGAESQIVKPANSTAVRAQMQAMNRRPARAKPNPALAATSGTLAGQPRPDASEPQARQRANRR